MQLNLHFSIDSLSKNYHLQMLHNNGKLRYLIILCIINPILTFIQIAI